jgi:hypothetical protein
MTVLLLRSSVWPRNGIFAVGGDSATAEGASRCPKTIEISKVVEINLRIFDNNLYKSNKTTQIGDLPPLAITRCP